MINKCVMALLICALGVVTAATTDYREAPALSEQVAADALPPVAERLPATPLVVTPPTVGRYGGTWRHGLLGGGDTGEIYRTLGWEHLVRWNLEWSEVIPNIAASWEVNEDASVYTFTLREGMRWSDGAPFTSADISFWYEDVLLNPELTPVVPGWLQAGGEPVVVEAPDATTVMFRFAAPSGLFLQRLATFDGNPVTRFPRHYLEQFHVRYNPEGVAALAREVGADDWVGLFASKGGSAALTWQNAELPTLNAWTLRNAYGEGTRVLAARNPYYWKVDSDGQQLPYLDEISYTLYQDSEVMLLSMIGGELDYMYTHINSPANRAVLFDNQDRSDYRFVDQELTVANRTSLAFNLVHPDPVKREVFTNKDFRIGLSYAIDRQEILDLIYIGQGAPHQLAPLPESPFYNEQLATQYTAFDVDLANEHLGRAFPERDAQGFRLGPDGQRISFVVEVADLFGAGWPDVMELVQGYWRAVGVDVQYRVVDRTLLVTRKDANQHDVVVWGAPGGAGQATLLAPVFFFPFNLESNFAIPWALWFSDPSLPLAEEPPAAAQQQMTLYRELLASGDQAAQAAHMEEILTIAADAFYAIGINSMAPRYAVVRNGFQNVPERIYVAWEFGDPVPANTSTFFLD